LSWEWKSEGVMDDENGEFMEKAELVCIHLLMKRPTKNKWSKTFDESPNCKGWSILMRSRAKAEPIEPPWIGHALSGRDVGVLV